VAARPGASIRTRPSDAVISKASRRSVSAIGLLRSRSTTRAAWVRAQMLLWLSMIQGFAFHLAAGWS
jgi:hypothetical protein